MRFVVDIELGNAEMETGKHVADALRTIADRVDGAHIIFVQPTEERIRDVNGNTVGSWEVKSDPLGLIGRDRALIDGLAKLLQESARREHNYGPMREKSRGSVFEIELLEGKERTGRVARVLVELDRVEQTHDPA